MNIISYIDGNGLVAPDLVPGGVIRASDNGVLHSSRYLIMQSLNNQSIDSDILHAVKLCVVFGQLERAPGDPSLDLPDDYYGIFSLCNVLNMDLSVNIPLADCQPMIIYMKFLSRNFLARLFSFPMAIVIAFSNLGENASDTSNKLLTWNIIQGTKKSLLCRLGAKIWNFRMNAIYTGGMKDIFRLYYNPKGPAPLPEHPLIAYSGTFI